MPEHCRPCTRVQGHVRRLHAACILCLSREGLTAVRAHLRVVQRRADLDARRECDALTVQGRLDPLERVHFDVSSRPVRPGLAIRGHRALCRRHACSIAGFSDTRNPSFYALILACLHVPCYAPSMFSHPVTSLHTSEHYAHAAAYDAMTDDRSNALVVTSYAVFARTLLAQWDALRHAVHFERWTGEGDSAYADSRAMLADVTERGHLWVYGTDTAQMDADHPLSASVPESMRQDDLPILNDVFRGVHDVMGHVVSGGSFGLNGEMRAWLAHRETFPRLALHALWCETRGQAAWTNTWADHGQRPLSQRPFAQQKCGIVNFDLI